MVFWCSAQLPFQQVLLQGCMPSAFSHMFLFRLYDVGVLLLCFIAERSEGWRNCHLPRVSQLGSTQPPPWLPTYSGVLTLADVDNCSFLVGGFVSALHLWSETLRIACRTSGWEVRVRRIINCFPFKSLLSRIHFRPVCDFRLSLPSQTVLEIAKLCLRLISP